MRVNAKILTIFGTEKVTKVTLTSDLQRSWMPGRRRAAGGRRGGESSERLRNERKNGASLLERGRERNGNGQNQLRKLSQRMNCASAMTGVAEGALRLFHLGSHGVQVVGGRDHGKQ